MISFTTLLRQQASTAGLPVDRANREEKMFNSI
jgi:hypothetical protein